METPQEYTARLVGYAGKKDPMKILNSTPKKIAGLIKKSKRKNLYKKPAPGKWSVAEIVAHLAETEIVMGWRYRSVVEKNGVKIQPFEQDDWAENSRYPETDIYDMLELMKVVRSANIVFLKGLPKEKYENFGMHEERGKETISHIMRMEAGHDINHMMQIEAILKNRHKKKKK
jgi:hypothetical protein